GRRAGSSSTGASHRPTRSSRLGAGRPQGRDHCGRRGACAHARRVGGDLVSGKPDLDQLRLAPKVLLHDHLDGGLRPATVVELAAEHGYRDLPTTDPGKLAAWFVSAAPNRDLVRYLEGFAHTVGVMQTREALERVATECVEDLA